MLMFSRTCLLLVYSIASVTPPASAQASGNLDCPGYRASNVVTTDSTVTADLTLRGTACNVYGTDLTDLQLVVEYQTGKRRGEPSVKSL